MAEQKKTYEKPELTKLGTLTDLTKTGLTRPGADNKQGSVLSQGQ
jgi:hypothetical protein